MRRAGLIVAVAVAVMLQALADSLRAHAEHWAVVYPLTGRESP